jgi:hypothetical protein
VIFVEQLTWSAPERITRAKVALVSLRLIPAPPTCAPISRPRASIIAAGAPQAPS